MNESLNLLPSLAVAAQQHASEQHRLEISIADRESLAVVDQILDCERHDIERDSIEPLTLCYGAWWGEYIRQHYGGRWIGLHEPVPPRIVLHGVVYSPLDAVRRRLLDANSTRLQSLEAQFGIDCDSSGKDADLVDSIANRSAWDDKANDPRFTSDGQLPSNREEALAAVDPWLVDEGPLESCRLLCLAAGGGTHGPLHAIAGARVTVVDYSPRQLQRDRQIAQQYGLSMQLICTSMKDLGMLGDGSFDAILHPVSLCYVREVDEVYADLIRLLRPGGIYISQQKQPTSMQLSYSALIGGYTLDHPADEGYRLAASHLVESQPSSSMPVNSVVSQGNREPATTEYIHSLDTLLGSLCRSGFRIEAVDEPPRADAWAEPGSPTHQARYAPPYIKIKARRSS